MNRVALASLVLALLAGNAAALVELAPLEGGARYRVTFKHTPVIGSQSVSVAGDSERLDEDRTP